jgi:hypothetical protein
MQGPPIGAIRHEAIPGRHSRELLASASLTGVAPGCSNFWKAALNNSDLRAYKFVIASGGVPSWNIRGGNITGPAVFITVYGQTPRLPRPL